MWSTRKQACISLSSTEAELVALCSSVTEGIWLQKLLKDLNFNLSYFSIFEDNQGCLNIIKNPGNTKRVKHIDIKYKFVTEKVLNKEIIVKYIATKNQIADILTKPLSKDNFIALRYKIGVMMIN